MSAGVYAFPGPALCARIREVPADFQVEEVLPFGPDGAGQHVWLTVRKTGLNTQEVARRLARLAGVRERDVGYAGMKDRHAVTTQTFTLDLAGRPEPDWSVLEDGQLQLLQVARHSRKLRRGALAGNHFALRLRALQGDPAVLAGRLDLIRTHGFPNYFGEQRFGLAGGNLDRAAALLASRFRPRDRHLAGIYLSAARAALFNMVLATRVEAGTWNQVLPGELVMLAGSRSLFPARPEELMDLQARAAALDLHPTGPLCGRGGLQPQGEAADAERAALVRWRGPEPFATSGLDWAAALAAQGLEADRRPLRALAGELTWTAAEDGGWLRFTLPAGSYATSLLDALLQSDQPLPAD